MFEKVLNFIGVGAGYVGKHSAAGVDRFAGMSASARAIAEADTFAYSAHKVSLFDRVFQRGAREGAVAITPPTPVPGGGADDLLTSTGSVRSTPITTGTPEELAARSQASWDSIVATNEATRHASWATKNLRWATEHVGIAGRQEARAIATDNADWALRNLLWADDHRGIASREFGRSAWHYAKAGITG